MTTRFRLTFDNPYSFATEQGYTHTRHCHDFRSIAGAFSEGAYRDPITGVVMLKPSYLRDDWYNKDSSWWSLPDWELNAQFWAHMSRTADLTGNKFLNTEDPGTTGGIISGFRAYDIAQISLASTLGDDAMVWVAQSKGELRPDEGFVFHFRTLSDEFSRVKNWFSLQWANIQIHFSLDGTVRCYRHMNGTNNTATLFDEFQIAHPGELVNKDGYFVFVPIPGFGLAIYHSMSSQRMNSKTSSAQSGVYRGHLIALPTSDTGFGARLPEGSKVTLGKGRSLNRMQHIFGFHRITYAASATFKDAIFDPGYKPTPAPVSRPGIVQTVAQVSNVTAITSQVLKPTDPEAAYATGDRQGRVKYTLTTSDPTYTPFLYCDNVAFNPVFSTRNTTPITFAHYGNEGLPDRVFALEFADDDNGRFEGSVKAFVTSDAMRKLIERGDMTFLLEKSLDNGATWQTHAGGLARVKGDYEIHFTNSGCHYIAQIDIADMYARFNELHQINQPAYDGQTLRDAIDNVLFSGAQPLLSSHPAELDTLRLPQIPKGANFRFAPQMGESGTGILHDILILARKQNTEYRMRHNWTLNQWIAERKPRDTSDAHAWTLTPWNDEIPNGGRVDRTARYAVIGSGTSLGSFSVMPPEANLLQPFGLDGTDPNDSNRVSGNPLLNVQSISDPTSYEYLGRVVTAFPMFAGLSELKQVNQMGRRVYDAACGRQIDGTVPMFEYVDELAPLTFTKIRTANRAGDRMIWDIRTPDTAKPLKENGTYQEYTGFWIKRREVHLDYNGGPGEDAPNVTLHLSNVWEGSVK